LDRAIPCLVNDNFVYTRKHRPPRAADVILKRCHSEELRAPERALRGDRPLRLLRLLIALSHSHCSRPAEPNIIKTVVSARSDWTKRLLEDVEMFARKGTFSSVARPVVMATVAALALSAVAPTMASARPIHRGFHGGGAAAAAAFAGIVGTGLAIAASRPYYDSYDGYYGPAPVYGGPVYDGGPTYSYYGGGPGYYYGGNNSASTVPFVSQNGSW
jgi:hypothetical protein